MNDELSPTEAKSAEGTLIAGRYQLLSLLGKGGMGAVWLAEHTELGERVAVKLLLKQSDASAKARFLREAQASARLRNPYVVQLLDYGVDGETPYLVMELLHGGSLSTLLISEGALPPERALSILRPIGQALSRAHKVGIVHRDLKPSNVQVWDEDGELWVKVLDFGIAKMLNEPTDVGTESGAVVGTPQYMSPEQAMGLKQIDPRADQWSFALLATECLTGRRVFDSRNLGDLVIQICRDPMPIPSELGPVPEGFDAWFAKATDRQPDRRFADMKATLAGLEAVFDGVAPTIGSGGSARANDSPGQSAVERNGGAPQGVKPISERSDDKPAQRKFPALLLGAAAVVVAMLIIPWAKDQLATENVPTTQASSEAAPAAADLRLTSRQSVDRVKFSPDGQRIAYTATETGDVELWVADRAGERRRLLKAKQMLDFDFHPTEGVLYWSGRRWADGRVGLWQASIEGDETANEPLEALNCFSVTADGKHVWGARHGVPLPLRVIDLETGDIVDYALDSAVQWVIGVDTSAASETVLLHVTAGHGNAQRLLLVDAKAPSRVVEFLAGSPLRSAMFAPNDTAVIYQTVRDGKLVTIRQAYDPETLRPTGDIEVEGGRENQGLAWDIASDGIGAYTIIERRYELHLQTLEQPETTRLMAVDCRIFSPRFSPRGDRIALAKLCPEQKHAIVTTNLSGHDVVGVSEKRVDSMLRWSPQGDRIAVFSKDSGVSQLWLLDATGADPPERVVHASPISDSGQMSWAPLDDILVQQPGNQNFTIVALDGSGGTRPLVSDPSAGWVFQPAVHPDKTRVAVLFNSADFQGQAIFDLIGKAPPVHLREENLTPIRFHADGSTLFAFDRQTRQIVAVRMPSGDIAERFALPQGADEVHVDADGKHAVYVLDKSETDLWLTFGGGATTSN